MAGRSKPDVCELSEQVERFDQRLDRLESWLVMALLTLATLFGGGFFALLAVLLA
jgi:hypothetical protein